MNNSCSSQKNLSPHEMLEQSDSQTIDHTNHTYDYLVNQIKIKSAALTKASNLIEILQLQLQIQKNSKKEAVMTAQNQLRQSYEIEIHNLNNKIQFLESAAAKKNLSVVLRTQMSSTDGGPKRQSRILKRSCSKQLNRPIPKDSRTNLSPQANPSGQIPFETRMYRKLLVENSIWDNQFVEQFQQLIRKQTQQIQVFVQNLSDLDQNFDHYYEATDNDPNKYIIYNKITQLEDIIKKQNKIISQMINYQSQLEELVRSFTSKLNQNLEQKMHRRIKMNLEDQVGQVVESIIKIIQKWKQKNKNREKKFEQQNKQLRQIVQQMIVLVNKKKNTSNKDFRSKLM